MWDFCYCFMFDPDLFFRKPYAIVHVRYIHSFIHSITRTKQIYYYCNFRSDGRYYKIDPNRQQQMKMEKNTYFWLVLHSIIKWIGFCLYKIQRMFQNTLPFCHTSSSLWSQSIDGFHRKLSVRLLWMKLRAKYWSFLAFIHVGHIRLIFDLKQVQIRLCSVRSGQSKNTHERMCLFYLFCPSISMSDDSSKYLNSRFWIDVNGRRCKHWNVKRHSQSHVIRIFAQTKFGKRIERSTKMTGFWRRRRQQLKCVEFDITHIVKKARWKMLFDEGSHFILCSICQCNFRSQLFIDVFVCTYPCVYVNTSLYVCWMVRVHAEYFREAQHFISVSLYTFVSLWHVFFQWPLSIDSFLSYIQSKIHFTYCSLQPVWKFYIAHALKIAFYLLVSICGESACVFYRFSLCLYFGWC